MNPFTKCEKIGFVNHYKNRMVFIGKKSIILFLSIIGICISIIACPIHSCCCILTFCQILKSFPSSVFLRIYFRPSPSCVFLSAYFTVLESFEQWKRFPRHSSVFFPLQLLLLDLKAKRNVLLFQHINTWTPSCRCSEDARHRMLNLGVVERNAEVELFCNCAVLVNQSTKSRVPNWFIWWERSHAAFFARRNEKL